MGGGGRVLIIAVVPVACPRYFQLLVVLTIPGLDNYTNYKKTLGLKYLFWYIQLSFIRIITVANIKRNLYFQMLHVFLKLVKKVSCVICID